MQTLARLSREVAISDEPSSWQVDVVVPQVETVVPEVEAVIPQVEAVTPQVEAVSPPPPPPPPLPPLASVGTVAMPSLAFAELVAMQDEVALCPDGCYAYASTQSSYLALCAESFCVGP